MHHFYFFFTDSATKAMFQASQCSAAGLSPPSRCVPLFTALFCLGLIIDSRLWSEEADYTSPDLVAVHFTLSAQSEERTDTVLSVLFWFLMHQRLHFS